MFFLKNKNYLISRNYHSASESLSFNQLPINKHQKKFSWTYSHLFNYLTIYFSIFLSALAYGIAMVLIALKLESNVKDDILITLSTVTQICAGVIFSNYLPRLTNKIGVINNIFYGSILAAISTLFLSKFINYQLWILCIFLMGLSLFISSISRNTVMIDFSTDKSRAFSISLGSLLVAIGNSLGPVLVNYINLKDNFITFAIAGFIHFLSGLVVLKLKKTDTVIRQQKKISPWKYIFNSPKIMFSGFAFSFAMSSCSAFAIIFGLRVGMTHENASLLLSALLIGTISYLPLSLLCNIFNLRFLIILFSLISLLIIHKIYTLEIYNNLHLYFFILFSSLAGMKLPTLVLINEKYKPSQRLAVNSSFSKVTLSGAIFGLICTGVLIKVYGYNGLWLSSAIILMIFIVFCFVNYFIKFLKGQLLVNDLSIFKKKYEPIEL
ncbi:hypothetical protein LBMAG18_00610 [Alphaproteobacteria bacterium]|nr:hypothetical protein LBMAG18_00610 [Alphaproteobacteria bacterium]